MQINLGDFVQINNKVLSGRDKGSLVRQTLKLNDHDDTDETINVNIYQSIYTL